MKTLTKTLMAGAVLAATSLGFSGVAQAADAKGVWERADGGSKMEIYDCDGKLCGKIVWLKEPNDDSGNPKTDQNNPDENLKSRQIVGMEFLVNMKPDGKDEWGGGKVYNPEDGKTYKAEMNLEGADKLKMGGCVLFICKKAEWNRSSL